MPHQRVDRQPDTGVVNASEAKALRVEETVRIRKQRQINGLWKRRAARASANRAQSAEPGTFVPVPIEVPANASNQAPAFDPGAPAPNVSSAGGPDVPSGVPALIRKAVGTIKAHFQTAAQAAVPIGNGAAAVRTQDEEAIFGTLVQIRRLFVEARSPHIALALQCGILPALLASLRSPHERLQLEAAWILTCIATGPIHQLLAAGTHKELIHLLRAKGQFDVCQQCIWALGNIIGDSIESKNRILQENFIPLLMEHITRSFNERKLAHLRVCSWVLASLTRGSEKLDLGLVVPYFPIISRLLHLHQDPLILADTCVLMRHLASPPVKPSARVRGSPHHVGGRNLQLLQAGLTRRLVEILYFPTPTPHLPALQALTALVEDGPWPLTAQIVLNAGVLDTLPRLVQSISGSKRASRRPPPSGDRVNNDLYVGASTGINDMGRLVLPGNGGFSTPMVSSSRSRGVETACGACELISALIQSGSGHSVGSGDDSIFEQLLHSSVLEAMIPGIIGGHAHLRGAAQAVLCQSLLACSSAQQLRCLASKGAVPAISGALRYVQSVQDLTNLLRVVYHMLQLERLDSSTTPSSEERGAADTVLLYGEPESKLPCSSMSPLARRPQAGKRPLYDQFTAMGLEDQLQSILTATQCDVVERAATEILDKFFSDSGDSDDDDIEEEDDGGGDI